MTKHVFRVECTRGRECEIYYEPRVLMRSERKLLEDAGWRVRVKEVDVFREIERIRSFLAELLDVYKYTNAEYSQSKAASLRGASSAYPDYEIAAGVASDAIAAVEAAAGGRGSLTA